MNRQFSPSSTCIVYRRGACAATMPTGTKRPFSAFRGSYIFLFPSSNSGTSVCVNLCNASVSRELPCVFRLPLRCLVRDAEVPERPFRINDDVDLEGDRFKGAIPRQNCFLPPNRVEHYTRSNRWKRGKEKERKKERKKGRKKESKKEIKKERKEERMKKSKKRK